MSKKQSSIGKKVGYSAFIVFLIFESILLSSAYDVQISAFFADVDTLIPSILDEFGTIVAPLLFSLSGIAMVTYFKGKEDFVSGSVAKRNIGFVVCLIGYGYIVANCFLIHMIVGIVATVLTTGLIFLAFKIFSKRSEEEKFVLFTVGTTCIYYSLMVLVTICVIKFFWGRVRPEDLVDPSNYTPFYLPQGYTGNYSFPSGHTANATVLFVITMFAPIAKSKIQSILLYVIPWVWSLLMALTRVMMWKHFTTDVVFGFLISIGLFILAKRLGGKVVAKAIDKESL